MSRRKRKRASSPDTEARVAVMHQRVKTEVRERPGVYRMISPDGEIVYVGKSKKLRTRLMGYFRAEYPQEKGARILREAGEISWEYQPSEFAALLEELRLIKRFRPRLNVMMKRDARHHAFIRIANSPAQKFQVVRSAGTDEHGTYYGPFNGAIQLADALRELNDVLGLRDCRLDLPMHFADQPELPVAPPRTPGCIRHEIGKCLGPCVAATTQALYTARFQLARAFLEGAHESPIETLRAAMGESSERLEFERAAIMRDKIGRLESLREQFARIRFAVESLSFVYTVPGHGDDNRAYIIRRGRVRAEFPAPRTAAERKMLAARAGEIFAPAERSNATVPAHEVDELLLLSSWFRKFPAELKKTVAIVIALLALGLPARGAAQGAPARASAVGRIRCDGDTVTTIQIRTHPPSSTGAAAAAWETTVQAAGFRHTNTRREVIASYLRVAVGRVCTERDRSETERLLRAQPFLSSVAVNVIPEGMKRVRLQVDAVDELPIFIAGRIAHGTVAALRLGTLNLAGLGLTVELGGERGYAYRNGVGAKAVQYGAFSGPFLLAAAASRDPVGESTSLEFAEPFLTDLQHRAVHAYVGEASDYYHAVRPAGEDVALYTRRTSYDLGWVTRIGRNDGRGVVGLAGAALFGEDVRVGESAVIISDTGFVNAPDAVFGARYPARAALRVAAIGGLRALRFLTVHGFDAITAQQDLGIGVQFDLLAGPSVWASRQARDVVIAGDLYAGVGGPRSFISARILAETRRITDDTRWDGVVGSSRFSWYGRSFEGRLNMVDVELSGVERLAFPLQLTFSDPDGGVRGFGDARAAGGRRAVARIEERRVVRFLASHADFAVAFFADAGKLWAGDVPYGVTTAVRAAAGISLLAAYPSGGKRTYRVDLAIPINPEHGGARFELRVRSDDRTRMLWIEPSDVARARTGAVPANLMKW